MRKIIIVALVLLFSCEKVVELNIPSHQPRLVVNGILDTDSIPSIFVSYSSGAFEQTEISCLLDANVLLYEDGVLLGEMTINPNEVDTFIITEDNWWNQINSESIYYYQLNTYPLVGSTYSIDVTHNDYSSVSATTSIPENLELVDFNIVDNSNNSETMIYNATFNLTFNDNPSQNNYYRIRLFLHTVGQEDEEVDEFIEKSYPLILYSNDPSLSQGIPWDGYTFSGRTALFSDDLFNGEQKSISFDMEYKLSGIEYGDSLFLQVTSFSEDGYKYFNSLERNRDRFISPFGTEPVPVYSNVNNGIGIFAGGNSLYLPVLP